MKEKPKRIYTTIFVSLIICALSSSALFSSGFAVTQINVTIASGNMIGSNKFSPGFALDGPDARIWRDTTVLRQLAIDANFKLVRFYENKMGKPCIHWDESTKTGTWDWTNIDSLMKRIFEIGAQPLITLGFYSWTYNRLTSAPSGMTSNPTTGLPYPDQWSAYCAEWVKHFKQVGLPVRYYEIIGEPHHYFGWPATQPKLGYFMKLFSSAAAAMRTADPNVKIGNDNSIMKSFLDYLLSQGEKLDFLSYHTYGTGNLYAPDSEILQAAETKYIGNTYYGLYGVQKALQVYKAARGVDLQVIDSENNVNYYYKTGMDPRTQQMLGAVYNALVFRTFMLTNISYNVYYTFGSKPSAYKGDSSGGAGFGMVNLDNNQPWYPYYAQKMIGSNLAVGDKIVSTSSSSDDIRAIAWIDKGKLDILLICKASSARTVYLTGVNGQLNYSKIDNTISWKTPKVQSGTVDSQSPITMNGYTVMLLCTL